MLELKKEVIALIEQKTGLTYIGEAYVGGAVCFANSAEVRPEYRQSFTAEDVLHYIYCALNSQPGAAIPYPENSESFWELAEKGKRLSAGKEMNTERIFETQWL